ncbi:ATP-binding protein [Streptomyces somaliensis]|nr:ATP-binding protein [Streptomyces somaliensis]
MLGERNGLSRTPVRTYLDWTEEAETKLRAMETIEATLLGEMESKARELRQEAQRDAIINGALIILVLGVSLIGAFVVARSMITSLRRLQDTATKVAQERLPQLVRQLSEADPQDVDTSVESVGVHSRDEIGKVAAAFDDVHREAVRLAAEQALLRGNVNAMFTNLSRRSQGLIQRQLSLISELESREADPDQLSSLFKLDHLATRMRRNGENLLVLAGEEPGRRWTRPVPLVDVLRAAASEVEQYERIELASVPATEVAGRVVNDLVHLLAELLENATSFSSPQTKVRVTGHALPDGRVLVEIHDTGIGLSPEDLAAINERLASPPTVDVSVSRRMGLFVVGRLSLRHGIRIQLRPSDSGGTTALVMLPVDVTQGGKKPGVPGGLTQGGLGRTPARPGRDARRRTPRAGRLRPGRRAAEPARRPASPAGAARRDRAAVPAPCCRAARSRAARGRTAGCSARPRQGPGTGSPSGAAGSRTAPAGTPGSPVPTGTGTAGGYRTAPRRTASPPAPTCGRAAGRRRTAGGSHCPPAVRAPSSPAPRSPATGPLPAPRSTRRAATRSTRPPAGSRTRRRTVRTPAPRPGSPAPTSAPRVRTRASPGAARFRRTRRPSRRSRVRTSAPPASRAGSLPPAGPGDGRTPLYDTLETDWFRHQQEQEPSQDPGPQQDRPVGAPYPAHDRTAPTPVVPPQQFAQPPRPAPGRPAPATPQQRADRDRYQDPADQGPAGQGQAGQGQDPGTASAGWRTTPNDELVRQAERVRKPAARRRHHLRPAPTGPARQPGAGHGAGAAPPVRSAGLPGARRRAGPPDQPAARYPARTSGRIR